MKAITWSLWAIGVVCLGVAFGLGSGIEYGIGVFGGLVLFTAFVIVTEYL